MNLKKYIYLTLNTVRLFRYPQIYRDLIKEEKSIIPSQIAKYLLKKLLHYLRSQCDTIPT